MAKTKSTPEKDWRWFGRAGHFCAAHHCLFHLHTHVGRYCISTMGEYFPTSTGGDYEIRNFDCPAPMGASEHPYESMVFRLDADDSPVNHQELTCRRTLTLAEAENVHMELCRLYATKG